MAVKVPPGLAARGRRFWADVTGKFELSTSELALLIEACRTMDNLDALDRQIQDAGAMTIGSTGQPVVNPALTEARGQRLALHRLIAALALPDEDAGAVPSAQSIRGKRAASVRWAGHVKERGA